MDLIVAGTIFVSPIVRLLIAKVSTYCSVDLALVWSVNGELKRLAQTLKLIEVVLDDAEKRQVENNLLVNWLGELKDVAYDAEDILAELQYKLLRNKMKKRTYGFGFKIAYKIRSVNTKLDGITNNMKRFNFINQLGSSGTNGNIPETSSNINDPAAVVGRMDDISKILDLLNQEIFSVVRITGMGGIGKTTLAQLVYAIADHFQIKMWVSVSRKSNIEEIFRDLLGPNFDRHSSLEDIVDRLKERLMVGKCLIVLDDVWMNRDINVQELLKDLLSMSCKGSKILMTTRSTVAIPPMTDCRYMIYQLQGLPKYDCWSIIKKIAFGHDGARETTDLVNIGKQIASKCGGLPLVAKTLGGLLYSKKDKGEWLSILNSQIWNLPTEQNKINSLLKLSYDHLSPHVKRCFSQCSIYPKGHYFLKKELILLWMAEGLLSHSNASPETLGNEYFKILLLNSFFLDEQRNKWGDIKFCRMHDLVHDLAISIAGNDSRMVNVSSENFIKNNDANVIQQPKFRRLGLQFLDYDACAIPSEIYTASKKLHTLVSFGRVFNRFYYAEGVWAKQISSLSLLRVLNLSHAGIEELPQSICKLKHLRYLDLSRTGIRTFPCSFCQLYSLQTLRLKGCNIKELPQDMGQLISLEHLIFSYKYRYRGSKNSLISARIELSQMPRDVSSLGKLKTLSLFIVGIGKGYGIEELKDLNLLGGKLIIENLGSVTDATQANLKGKKDIIHLQLRWDSQSRLYDDEVAADDGSNRSIKDNVVINGLQPHPNLKELRISCFAGSKFPTWMMSTSVYLPNLVYITLEDCGNCEHLPALGRLQSLRYLYMEGMRAIKQIGFEFYRSDVKATSNEEASFPSLVELHLCYFTNLEEWLEDQRSSTCSFSSLEMLEIVGCDKLLTTPTRFPSLKKLSFPIRLSEVSLKSLPLKLLHGTNNVLQTLHVSFADEFLGFLQDDEEHQHYQPDDLCNNFLSEIEISHCHSLTSLPAFRGLNAMTYLKIEECRSLQSLPDGIQYLPALRTLTIGGFSRDLVSFPFPEASGSDGEQYFVSLRELKICGWPTLRDVLPEQLQLISSLQCFTITGFPCLLSLPEWFGVFSSLQTLDIYNCQELKYLPSAEQMLRLTSLKKLNIRYCPLLQKRCRNEELHKIAHLTQVNNRNW